MSSTQVDYELECTIKSEENSKFTICHIKCHIMFLVCQLAEGTHAHIVYLCFINEFEKFALMTFNYVTYIFHL